MSQLKGRWASCPHGLRNRRVCQECWDDLYSRLTWYKINYGETKAIDRPSLDSLLRTIPPRHTKDLPIVGKG